MVGGILKKESKIVFVLNSYATIGIANQLYTFMTVKRDDKKFRARFLGAKTQ